uniref:Uncharacterized protein n=2 Tax=Opuntia streptacantha TaxID=393608 RepID=A0A7C9AK43_OPUST
MKKRTSEVSSRKIRGWRKTRAPRRAKRRKTRQSTRETRQNTGRLPGAWPCTQASTAGRPENWHGLAVPAGPVSGIRDFPLLYTIFLRLWGSLLKLSSPFLESNFRVELGLGIG